MQSHSCRTQTTMTSPIFLFNNWRPLVAVVLAAVILMSSAPLLAGDKPKDDHRHDRYHGHHHDHDVREQENVMHESHDPQALLAAAVIAQSRHDFALAEQLLRESLVLNSHNDEAWLMRASIHLVRGETESAGTACGQLRTSGPLVILTCNARVALATGQHELALPQLLGVLNVVDGNHIPPPVLAWSYSVAGDLAVANVKAQEAEELYHRSLALDERAQVKAALVDVLLSEANYEGAWQVVDTGSPNLSLLVRRLIVAKRLNRLDDLHDVNKKVQHEFEAWIAHENWLYAREMTRYFIDVVDRPELARHLALINISLQQEPEDLLLERRTRARSSLAVQSTGQTRPEPRRYQSALRVLRP